MQFGMKKIFSVISAFLVAWIALRFLLPLFLPFLVGALLALAAEPFTRYLCRRLHLPRSFSAGVSVSLTFALICGIALLVCAFVLRELGLLAQTLPQLFLRLQEGLTLAQQWLLSGLGFLPKQLQPIVQENIYALFSSGTTLVDQSLRHLLSFAGNLISHIPDSALSIGTSLLSAFMIAAKLPRLKQQLLHRLSPERVQTIQQTGAQLKKTVSGWLAAQLKLMGVTFILLLSGFFLLKIPNPFLWAAGTALVDAFPVLGTGAILLPWSLIRFLQGDSARAIGLAGIYVTVSLLRSALEPKLVGRQLGLDPLATLVILYVGFRLWGIPGMLLAPLIAVSALQILPRRHAG
ncbi:MAG: sporulation integral membrane protein YtvI [Oscillospiraceae bacterium]|nr:sporulation integral membrane protein YtvI [Oscillospiraceae bacterium]